MLPSVWSRQISNIQNFFKNGKYTLDLNSPSTLENKTRTTNTSQVRSWVHLHGQLYCHALINAHCRDNATTVAGTALAVKHLKIAGQSQE